MVTKNTHKSGCHRIMVLPTTPANLLVVHPVAWPWIGLRNTKRSVVHFPSIYVSVVPALSFGERADIGDQSVRTWIGTVDDGQHSCVSPATKQLPHRWQSVTDRFVFPCDHCGLDPQ